MTFDHLPDRPAVMSADWVRSSYHALVTRARAAESSPDPEAWLELFSDWNELKSALDSEESRIHYRLTRDLRDAGAVEAERFFREELAPPWKEAEGQLVAALLASRHIEAVGARYGAQLVRVLRAEQPNLAPINAARHSREGELCVEYAKLLAGGHVELRGETHTLTSARSFFGSEDAELRHEAFRAYMGWFSDHRTTLARLLDELIAVRDEMGRALGDADFVPLGYARMKRTDYGPDEVARFRRAVREHIAPLWGELARDQARALGTPTLEAWDLFYSPGRSLPKGIARPIDTQLDRMERAIERLSPRLAGHLRVMRAEDRIDLESREGKAGGAYSIAFPDEPGVGLFLNSTGDEEDLTALTHELGHAFQTCESGWIEAVDLRSPSSEAGEIPSMGLEFLALPYLDEFLTPDQLRAFARDRWRRSVLVIAFTTLLDDFQHWIYQHPSATPAEREHVFVDLLEQYQPGVDWSAEGSPDPRVTLYRLEHLFRLPFYSIDYAIAETSAMQLGRLDARDHARCLDTYLELCRLGGTESLTGLLKRAGLRSPFDDGLIEELAAHARRELLDAPLPAGAAG